MKTTAEEIMRMIKSQIESSQEEGRKFLAEMRELEEKEKMNSISENESHRIKVLRSRIHDLSTEIHALELLEMSVMFKER